MTRIGSLFSGYEGLTMAVQAVIGGDVAWVSDIDPGACKILKHHWPAIPNLGDITAVDWSQVEPVDVITGGFPCQDVSMAGRRAGMAGHRSGLWARMHDAIAALHPSLVVIENVRGLLSARGDEPTPELLAAWDERDKASRVLRLLESKLARAQREGKPDHVHRHAEARDRFMGRHKRAMAGATRADARIIRAIGTVLGSLADIGFDAAWYGISAASVGAPHGRFRLFIIAWPVENTDRSTGGQRWFAAPGQAPRGWARADTCGSGGAPTADPNEPGHLMPDWGATPDTTGDGRHEWWAEPTGFVGGPDAAIGGASVAPDTYGGGREVGAELHGEPEQTTADWNTCGQHVDGHPGSTNETAWGQFEPAIRRWESLTRPAPAPTELSSKGGQRLSPRFVEWMQGLPDGHVTGVPGVTRNEQLKALGNGVVPQQAEAALRYLFSVCEVAA